MDIKLGLIIGGVIVIGKENENGDLEESFNIVISQADKGDGQRVPFSINIIPMFLPLNQSGSYINKSVLISTSNDIPPGILAEYQKLTSGLVIPNIIETSNILRGTK